MRSTSRRRPAFRAVAMLALAAVAGSTLTLAAAPAATAAVPDAPEGDRSSFVLPIIPDTQFYSRYSASQFMPQYGTNPFEVQTQWIVDNQDELNIPFAVHVGDVVDQEWVTGEWDAAQKAMKILSDGGVDYSILPGNHDVSNQGARSSEGISGNYLSRFNTNAMRAQAGDALIGSFQNGLSTAYLFEAEGHQWMSLAVAWNASDDTFAWAQGILDAHPGVPVVLSSHAIINIAEDQQSPAPWWFGDLLWDRLIRGNDQIIATVNGHFHGSTMQTRTNDAGHPVYQLLTDYQMAADGGNGIMTLLEFDLSNDRIDVETVSPWVTRKHADSIGSSDTPVLDGTWQSFSIDFDFGARFGWTVDPADETKPDLSERAKEIVSEGWDDSGNGGAQAPAGNAADYVEVDGTVAHWRFGDLAEGVVDENTVIPDVAGASPMHRNAIDQTDAPEEPEDVTVSHTNRPFYSSDFGAVCFSDVGRNATGPDRMSFLQTEYGAPATFADLDAESGYTIETFLQLDADWTEGANRWSSALTRGGARQWIGIPDASDPGAGAAWIGISNLREYQYSAGDARTGASYTLWSGEIMPSAWHHVAIVNDPAARTAIMYVDGVPVLRNASGVAGMKAADYMPWVLGASTWNTEPDHGWHGCIGETRIVDRALTSGEFLTARADIDADGENFSLTTDTATARDHDAVVAELSGTGFAGAQVRVERADRVVGTATVAADGSWTVPLDEPFAGTGSHAFEVVQSLGERDGRAFQAVLTIGARGPWSPVDTDLTPETDGLIQVTPETFVAGQAITISLPAGHDGERVHAFLFSEPTALGAATAEAGTARLVTPTSLPTGAHRLALYTADGDLIGWDAVTITAPVDGGTGGDPVGGGTDGGAAPVDSASPAEGALAVTGLSVGVLLLLVMAGVGAIAFGVAGVLRRRQEG
ncbi:LamG-like jellyroll fold domain-containing protein [Microbacterium sp. NPDC089189]|uniref:LamG-like jellyroll fold domain-containing protein n=1 Tax=Microbacterium sp. NPDC089189 TaxID=3154972 RepID=UPI003429E6C3